MNEARVPNKLIEEKSPYLLQHAHNPVNWYPWGDEAFEKALKEDKPIFLSIGYSTCHWCHVMEKLSFEDEEVGQLLNEHFISIKVDREERPDIDHIYMEICQALTGSGGWPLTIIMSPDKKPFFAGTYYPKHSRGQHPGLIELLTTVETRWKVSKSELLNSAEEITRVIKEHVEDSDHSEFEEHIIEKAYNILEMSFDKTFGGFGSSPKFPTPHNLLYLLRYSVYKNNKKALDMVEKTLMQMYKGGIFDHIGYGFSRYSVDKKWLVPHFEKMLYDNAFLAITYTEAYLATNNEIYKEVAEKILEYISRDMTSPDGAFYTAEDADSEGVEGKFYVWDKQEIYNILDKDEADYICQYYGVTETGNFENKNILNLIHQEHIELDTPKLQTIRKKLYDVREKRIHPHKDDKVLTSWNSMMIAAFAIAGKALNNDQYIEKAEKACNFIINNLLTEEHRLLARFRDSEAKYYGYLDDYAYFEWGLIELFLATSKEEYINRAVEMNIKMMDLFEDADNGGFFYSGKDSEPLIMKNKEIYDGAIPSGNSVLTMNLIRLSEITDDIGLERLAVEQFHYFASRINDSPTAHTYMLSAYMMYKNALTKIVFVTDKDKEMKDIKHLMHHNYRPFTTAITLFKDTIRDNKLFSHYANYEDPLALYVCQNYTCDDPIYNKNEIVKKLNEM
ncbi:MAG: thioredoxin protein [Haloplasmataceae bacterium]|jgi:uncharacterized protein YyaL (SSP411 family)|nr:thioredoxin protein [Haloplasmataceae bacterium]